MMILFLSLYPRGWAWLLGPKIFWRVWGCLMWIGLLMSYSLLSIHLQSRPWLEERGFGNSERQVEVVTGDGGEAPNPQLVLKNATLSVTLYSPLLRWFFLSSGCWFYLLFSPCHGCTKFISDVTWREMWFVLNSGPSQPEGQTPAKQMPPGNVWWLHHPHSLTSSHSHPFSPPNILATKGKL